MKDAFGRELKVGDQIAYIIRQGSHVGPEMRTVVEVDATYCKVKWVDEWSSATRTSFLKTPHLIIRL